MDGKTLRGLRHIALGSPLGLVVRGDSMAPHMRDGARVQLSPSRFYWPGDVLAVRARGGGGLLLHRVIGYLPVDRTWQVLTQGDGSPTADAPVKRDRILGKVRGGECSPLLVRVPLRHRIWALGRFARALLGRLVRR